jgi:hypothetical protein
MNITAPTNPSRTAKRIQRALKKDPNDIGALLQLAAMLGTGKTSDRDQKRRVLRHILFLEPGHQKARQMLLEMDRVAIGGNPSRLSLAVILQDPSSSDLREAPLTLRYSIVHQLLVYLFIACAVLAGLSIVREMVGLVILGVSLMIPLWFVSAVIEIGDSGLNVSRLFGLIRSEIPWRDIREIRSAILGQGMIVIPRAGKTVEISARVHGYPFLIDLLRQKRPDLFPAEAARTTDIPQNRSALTSLQKR